VGIILVIIYILVCLFLVMVVLLQQGKGADLAGAFGGGGSQASFGPRSSTNIMHRMTTVSFVLFVVLSMTLAILSGKARTSVMEDTPEAAPVAAVEVETGGTDGTVMDTTEEAPAQDLTLEPEQTETGDTEGAPEAPADQG
jgi:preprotein translocase subunit SecG